MYLIWLILIVPIVLFLGTYLVEGGPWAKDKAALPLVNAAGVAAISIIPTIVISIVLCAIVPLASGTETVKTDSFSIEQVDDTWYSQVGDDYSFYLQEDDGYRQYTVGWYDSPVLIRGSEDPRVEYKYCDKRLRDWGFNDPTTCEVRIYVP